MPSFRKLSAAEAAVLEQGAISARTQIAHEYDAYLVDFAAGDQGRVELHEDEHRSLVRGRLQGAARRRGWVLRFRSGPGPLTFRVEAGARMTDSPADRTNDTARIVAETAPAEGEMSETSLSKKLAQRPSDRRQSATERYHEVLPRWMRTGQSSPSRNQRKRGP
jgi:hypothetical protein